MITTTITTPTPTTFENPTEIAASAGERVKAIAAALLLGSVLVFTVGFAHSASIHNAAHDTRHGLAFPCH